MTIIITPFLFASISFLSRPMKRGCAGDNACHGRQAAPSGVRWDARQYILLLDYSRVDSYCPSRQVVANELFPDL